MTYSLDFRRKVLSVREREELTIAEVAERFGVGVASVVRWLKDIEIKPHGFRYRKIDIDVLKKDIELYPDAYQYERAARLGVRQNAIVHALKKLSMTYKKTLRHPKANDDARQCFQEKIKQYEAENRPIVYIDESGFAHDMPRTHGYTLKGTRCYGTQDWHARGRINVIGALLGKVLLTVSLFTTTIDTDVFAAWTKQDLVPKLPAASVVVMDNATFHKRQDIEEALTHAGHTLYFMPTYSPDLNPIERKWAQKKAQRRKENCSIEALFTKSN